ncbi:MAG: hypothetical protein A2X86_02330 [Bdellovibrionales bacterium GWA2_49_15]|nr:MAG: hypothetical protein A2X86_02330 [Bdellovibrionales bacterium GWA2_49_15]
MSWGQVRGTELDEFHHLYANEIQEYGTLMQSVERMEGELVLAHETYQNEQCDSPYFTAAPECRKVRAEIQRRTLLITDQRRQLSKLKIKLKDYLGFTHGVLENVTERLQGNRNSVSQGLTCLESLGALTWSPEINTLYVQGMTILLRQNRQLYFEHLRSLPGFSREECRDDDQVECWRQDSGVYYYVARGHIQISEGCLTRQAAGTNLDWSTFPSRPMDYLEAARQVAQTVAPKKGCYTGINKDKAEDLAFYYKNKHPRIQCTPDTLSERKTSGSGERCAYTFSGALDLFLTAPNLCGGLARTVFHESLHAEGRIDNLQTQHHNNGVCRAYDAVYHCSFLCFPEKPRPRFFHRRGCERCVSDDKVETLCRGLPEELGPSFQSCGWGRE